MSNTNDILSRLSRCCALLGVVADDLAGRGADTNALKAVHDLLSGICQDFTADMEYADT